MGSPPDEELANLERELEHVDGQLGSPLSADPQGSPGRQDLLRRQKAIEDRLVQLRRENDRALGEDLVDADLNDIADPPEPGS